MLGHRAIDHDGWRAVCPWPGPSFTEAGVGFGQPISAERLSELDATRWELYHVAEDSAENHDVAAENRDRLIAMISTWYVEAGKYGVLPIDGSGLARMVAEKPLVAPPRDHYIVPTRTPSRCRSSPDPASSTVRTASPLLLSSPRKALRACCSARALPQAATRSTCRRQRLHYVHNYVGRSLHHVASPEALTPGAHELRFEFEPTGPARSRHRARSSGPAPAVRRR